MTTYHFPDVEVVMKFGDHELQIDLVTLKLRLEEIENNHRDGDAMTAEQVGECLEEIQAYLLTFEIKATLTQCFQMWRAVKDAWADFQKKTTNGSGPPITSARKPSGSAMSKFPSVAPR